jgi:hypothetical protein
MLTMVALFKTIMLSVQCTNSYEKINKMFVKAVEAFSHPSIFITVELLVHNLSKMGERAVIPILYFGGG